MKTKGISLTLVRRRKTGIRSAAAVSALVLTALLAVGIFPLAASAYQVVNTDGSLPTTLQNPSFEFYGAGTDNTIANIPTNPPPSNTGQYPQAQIPGWCTTDPDKLIEIWGNGFHPGTDPEAVNFYASDGDYFAEINATNIATLYQDLATLPGGLYMWGIDHCGRIGYLDNGGTPGVKDEADLLLAGEKVADLSDTNGATAPASGRVPNEWNTGNSGASYTGYYTATSAVTRFELQATSSAGGNLSRGNLVDNAKWIPIAFPTEQTIWAGDPLAAALSSGTPDEMASKKPADVSPLPAGYTQVAVPTNTVDLNTSTAGNYLQVPVPIKDSNGTVIGTIYSIVHVLATVTTNYVDESGNPIAAKDVQKPAPDTANYSTTNPPEITGTDGKVYVPVPANGGLQTGSDPASGPLEGNKNVTYVYKLKPQTLTTEYVDESGNVLGTPTTTGMNNGDPYNVPTPGATVTINGKTYQYVKLDPTSDPQTGTMNADKTVKFVLKEVQVYTVSGNVTGLPKNSGVIISYTYTDPNTGKTVKGKVPTDAKGNYSIPNIPAGTSNLVLTPQSKDGYTVDYPKIKVPTIKANVTKQNYVYKTQSTPPAPSSGGGTSNTPKTSDSMQPLLWFGALGVCAALIVCLLLWRRRSSHTDQSESRR